MPSCGASHSRTALIVMFTRRSLGLGYIWRLPEFRHWTPGVATRVREDRVALRVLQEIETALSASVPPGRTLVFTLGAPIQRPRDLIVALTQRVRLRLETASDTATKTQIVGNRVRYQVSRRQLGCKAACLGFVFTGDLTPASLLNCMRQLGRALARRAPRGLAMTVDERWLLFVAEDTYVDIKTYRRLYACLSVSHNYKNVLLFKNGSKVEVLESPTSDAVVLGSHRKQC